MKLSEHFSLEEFTASATALKHGIDNTPPAPIIPALIKTAEGMERVRVVLGCLPIHVNSAYRCDQLNTLVHGSKNSDHPKGRACDFICPQFGTPREIARVLAEKMLTEDLGIDQLIFEGTWVHVSFSSQPRKQVLTMIQGSYVKGIV